MPAIPRDPDDTAASGRVNLETALIEARCFFRVIELATDDRPEGFDKHDVGAINVVISYAIERLEAALDRNAAR